METVHIFLFCNPTSGGNQAARLLNLPGGVTNFDFEHAELGCRFTVDIYNLKEESSRKAGFEALKSTCESEEKNVRVVAAGGDGTVKWVIDELVKISMENVPIGVIPFGTGNDMARVLGWGSTAPSPLIGGTTMKALKNLLTQLAIGELSTLNVWRVVTKCHEEKGHFDVAVHGKIEERKDKARVVVEHMINYCSFGQDARAVFGFERHRRTTQFLNKIQYAMEGGKLSAFHPARRLNSVQLFVDGEDFSEIIQSKQGLIFQNIPSYAAGSDFWGASEPWTPGDSFCPQMVGDELLEVHSLHRLIDIGLNKATGGVRPATSRLAQGKVFKVIFDPDSIKPMYFHVDGEPCRITSPVSCEIFPAFHVTMIIRNDAKAGLIRSLGLDIGTPGKESSTLSSRILYSSFLLKARKRLERDTWNTRYVALIQREEGRAIVLEWYAGPVIRRRLYLVRDGKLQAEWSKIDHGGKRPNTCFQVVIGKNCYYFAANSQTERDEWITNLDCAVNDAPFSSARV